MRDEISFQFLLNDRSHVLLSFFVGGVAGQQVKLPLGFDCSTAYHNYALRWTNWQIV